MSKDWSYSWINLADTDILNSFVICPFTDPAEYSKSNIYVYSLRIRLLYPVQPFATVWTPKGDDYELKVPRARFIFFQWFSEDDPTLASILQDNSTVLASYMSGYKRHPSYKVRILKDFTVSPPTHVVPTAISDSDLTFTGNKPIRLLFRRFKHRWYINPKTKPTRPQDLIGRIYMAIIRLNAGTLYDTNFQMWARLNYTDID